MADSQLELVGDSAPRERWKEFDADFTPRAVVSQGLRVISQLCGTPRVFWDPCAGGGVFGSVARQVWPECTRWGTEIRPEEWPNLERNYEHAAVCSFLDKAPRCGAAATNPPWCAWAELVPVALDVLEVGGWLALLGPVSWGSSHEHADGLDVFERHPPFLELRVPGRIRYRTGINPKSGKPYTSDHRKCAWWVWTKTADGRARMGAHWPDHLLAQHGTVGWRTLVLPQLAAEEMRWTVRPGTEWTLEASPVRGGSCGR